MKEQSSQKTKKRGSWPFAGQGGLFAVFVFGVLIQRGL